MSLIGTLNLASNALAVQQTAIQVTGNNIANVSDADYTRQTVELSPGEYQQITPGIQVGTGVNLDSVSRQIDDSLEQRLRGSDSDSASATEQQNWLNQVQSTFDALGTDGLSTSMDTFFSSWSDLANAPQDAGKRQVVIQNGQSLASGIQGLSSKLNTLGSNIDQKLMSDASDADSIATQVATLNGEIVTAETGGTSGEASGLEDQRDAVLTKLAGLMDITTIKQDNGAVNVYVGSEPLVMQDVSRGITTKVTTDPAKPVGEQDETELVFKDNNGSMTISSGEIAGLRQSRDDVQSTSDSLNMLAHNLIFELNKLHASGQGLDGMSSVTSTSAVADPNAALDTAAAGLNFTPNNGSFVVHVTNKTTGLDTTTLIPVNLNGAASGDSLATLTAKLNNVTGLSASVVNGQLKISAASSSVDFSFSQDSSGVLAAVGVNTFFTGTDASDIAINSTVAEDPNLLAAAKNNQSADNQTAQAIASLQTQSMAGLNGSTLSDSYQSMMNDVSTKTAAAKTTSDASSSVVTTLTSQRQALSGVSLNEESINLMAEQRAFQGSARVITVVNTMLDEVMNLIA